MKDEIVYLSSRRQTRLEQLQARDHQRRMSPERKAGVVAKLVEAFAWLCFGLYLLYLGATWGWR